LSSDLYVRQVKLAQSAAYLNAAIRLPWPRLGKASQLLRPGSLAVIGGAPGCGKSFFALACGMAAEATAEDWTYLPLESDRVFHLCAWRQYLTETGTR
jgi:hypothetical protein